MIQLKLKRTMNKWRGISIFLLGYKKGVSFSAMPKIEIMIRMNHLSVKNKNKSLSTKEFQLTSRGKEQTLSIPMSLLGDPDFIISGIKTKRKDLSIDKRAWRILDLD